jgi:hypothetical protein
MPFEVRTLQFLPRVAPLFARPIACVAANYFALAARFRLTVFLHCITIAYMKDKLTTVRLTAEQTRNLERIGARDDRSISWLIRKAVDDLVRRDKQ